MKIKIRILEDENWIEITLVDLIELILDLDKLDPKTDPVLEEIKITNQ